jgi:hypothetical protein
MPHKDLHVLIPRTCEYVTLHGKRDFANVLKLRFIQLGLMSSQGAFLEESKRVKVRAKKCDDGSRERRYYEISS